MERHERFGRAVAVVGAQMGSEGKGAVTEYLAGAASACVRIGAANAGHTVYCDGVPYVLRQIPAGWVNPSCVLVIGISALVSLDVLLREIEVLERVRPVAHRLYIDRHAHVITDAHIERERRSGLAGRIGSTSARSGLGIGVAAAEKVLRDPACVRAEDVSALQPYVADTVELLNSMLELDQLVLFEGTQGFGLSIEHGSFPYVTSRDTTAQSLFAGTGVNPYGFDVETILVARAYPIRVGGTSGPFDPDSEELTWAEVARRAGTSRDLTERTSVTGTVRRVATFSALGFERACMVNRPSEVVLTFADHIDAAVHESQELTPAVDAFIERMESIAGVPVGIVKTGPRSVIDTDWYRRSMLRKMQT